MMTSFTSTWSGQENALTATPMALLSLWLVASGNIRETCGVGLQKTVYPQISSLVDSENL
jgi:hypothetical protein